jgi:acetyltransferase-like isoleucine patch superfamily enzyme
MGLFENFILFIIRLFLGNEKYGRYLGVKIGRNCKIETKYFGSEPYLIEIGDHVQITNGVRFFTHGGAWIFRCEDPNFDFFGKIRIGNNVYIGNCSFILPGVSIGNNVIIGAGSIVTKSVPDNSIIAGNPAAIIGSTKNFKNKISEFNLNCRNLNKYKKKKYLLSLNDNNFLKKKTLSIIL